MWLYAEWPRSKYWAYNIALQIAQQEGNSDSDGEMSLWGRQQFFELVRLNLQAPEGFR